MSTQPKSFICNTYRNCVCKSFISNTYKKVGVGALALPAGDLRIVQDPEKTILDFGLRVR